MERLMRNNLKQKATHSLKLLQDSEYEIYQLENAFVEFQRLCWSLYIYYIYNILCIYKTHYIYTDAL